LKKGLKISDEEQQAIVAFHTIDFIMKIEEKDFLHDSRSIRERIFGREYLTKSILERASLYAKEQKLTNESFGAKE
jgi:hypothetical protein